MGGGKCGRGRWAGMRVLMGCLLSTGLQLSTWIAGEGLYDIAGGGR